jgi:beta-lactamase superfamily II metal-dependent hydrolase
MLLDCGKHMSSKTGHTISEAAKDIVQTVANEGRQRLDVVVATHRHYDHIGGFALKLWDEVEVAEVWMPWTDEVGNPAADRIRQNQNRLALALAR